MSKKKRETIFYIPLDFISTGHLVPRDHALLYGFTASRPSPNGPSSLLPPSVSAHFTRVDSIVYHCYANKRRVKYPHRAHCGAETHWDRTKYTQHGARGGISYYVAARIRPILTGKYRNILDLIYNINYWILYLNLMCKVCIKRVFDVDVGM